MNLIFTFSNGYALAVDGDILYIGVPVGDGTYTWTNLYQNNAVGVNVGGN
jgi:hypothetical protein